MASTKKPEGGEAPDDKAAARAARLEEVQKQINELVKEREALLSGVDVEDE